MKAHWVYRKRRIPVAVCVICLAVLLAAVTSCGCLAPSALAGDPAGPGQIILTWTGDPASSQTVTWLMPDNLAAGLQYLEAEQYAGNFDSAPRVDADVTAFGSSHYRYSVTLSGLEADTQYVYRAGCDGAWSDTLSFTTASGTEEFSFLYLGDLQSGYAEWAAMMDSVKQDYPGLKFSLMGGDLTDDGDDEAEWGQFLDAAAGVFSEIPLMPAMGNHDGLMYLRFFALPDNGPEGLQQGFYSFDYGNAHFVVLDSGNNTDERAKQWLQEDLQNTDKTWKFAMFHHPAYPAFDDYKTIDESICENWVPTLEQNGVDMVFVGHQHLYMRTHPIFQGAVQAGPAAYGIVYVMGNAGSKFYSGGSGFSYIAAEQTGSSCQVINIDGDVLTLTSRKASGELIETYTIDKSLKPPPDLTADTSANRPGMRVDLKFRDDAAWRRAITGISVNGSALSAAQYSLAKGKLRIDGGVFSAEGDYEITVRAVGYEDGVVVQPIAGKKNNKQ